MFEVVSSNFLKHYLISKRSTARSTRPIGYDRVTKRLFTGIASRFVQTRRAKLDLRCVTGDNYYLPAMGPCGLKLNKCGCQKIRTWWRGRRTNIIVILTLEISTAPTTAKSREPTYLQSNSNIATCIQNLYKQAIIYKLQMNAHKRRNAAQISLYTYTMYTCIGLHAYIYIDLRAFMLRIPIFGYGGNHCDLLSLWSYVLVTLCPCDLMSFCPCDLMSVWPCDHVTMWPYVIVSLWPCVHVTSWTCDLMTLCPYVLVTLCSFDLVSWCMPVGIILLGFVNGVIFSA